MLNEVNTVADLDNHGIAKLAALFEGIKLIASKAIARCKCIDKNRCSCADKALASACGKGDANALNEYADIRANDFFVANFS